jgi:dual specificity MAP kinase phosphatase
MANEICEVLQLRPRDNVEVVDIDAWLEDSERREYEQAQESIAEIIPNLFLGDSSVSANRDELQRRGIKRVINVSVDLPTPFEDIQYMRIPIHDNNNVSIKQYFQETFKFIDAGLKAGEGVLVHCFAGISRSPTIVFAYLMKRYEISYDRALLAVRSKRCIVDPNFSFCIQLFGYEKELIREREEAAMKATGGNE